MGKKGKCAPVRVRAPAREVRLRLRTQQRKVFDLPEAPGITLRRQGGRGMQVFGIMGWKNSGKTGLVERLIAEITGRGFRVASLKHAHHAFDVDQPGKDSFRHRRAGAVEVMLSSSRRWALMHELGDEDEPPLERLLARLSPCDLVLVEGYKRDAHLKIEANRRATGQPLLALEDDTVCAVASDQHHAGLDIPQFDLDDTVAIADFILERTGLGARAGQDGGAAGSSGPGALKNDCFALPPGVNWIPVDDALAMLRERFSPSVGTRTVDVAEAGGRILASDQIAVRANPPGPNSAVDGYAFAQASTPGNGPFSLTLLPGRAAAGAPYEGRVAPGQAVRILTGALLPAGADTVVMQEDVSLEGAVLGFAGPVRRGMNTRAAGEDVKRGEAVFAAGRRLRAPDLALLSAVGIARVEVREKLRVAVLSTGDEIVPPDAAAPAPAAQTYDANRPMLLALVRGWGHAAVDLGHVGDDTAALRERLDAVAAGAADAVLTSGGASAGDEDHVSALLRREGTMQAWRIALKPGRPLALGTWKGLPVFGLPGNPVATLVTAAIFARPALSAMAGGGWLEPAAFTVPAAFSKAKKGGRREYLRARINDAGAAEVFASEGSGRISGLSWASGLVELGDEARRIRPGTPVRFIPFQALGLAM